MRFKYIDPISLNSFKIKLKSDEEKEVTIQKLKEAVDNKVFPINDYFLIKGDQSLRIDPKKLYPDAPDFEIAKWLSSNLDIDRVEASMPEFWTYISIKYCWSYLIDLLKINANEENWIKKLEPLFIFTSSQNNLMSHPLASLWWTVELFKDIKDIDDSKRNELLKVFLKDKNLRIKNFGKHQLIRNPEVLRGITAFYRDNAGSDYNGKKLPTEAFAQQLMKFVNHRAGANLVTLWSHSDVYDFLNQYKSKIFDATLNVGERKVMSRLKMEDKRSNELFFLLNSKTGEYEISETSKDIYYYRLPFRKDLNNQYIYHFYKEGKIKKTHISEEIIHKKRDKIYQNGKNNKLTLVDCLVASDDFLIGIAHVYSSKIYVKINNSNDEMFRADNDQLHQEGKKISPYSNYSKVFHFKNIPMESSDKLKSLFFKSPQAKGSLLTVQRKEVRDELDFVWPEVSTLH